MDYVDFIVHVFSAEKRSHYGLERMRKSATTISVAELSAELKELIATTRARTAKPAVKTAPAKKSVAKKAPAKKPAPKKIAAKNVSVKLAASKKVVAKSTARTTVKKT